MKQTVSDRAAPGWVLTLDASTPRCVLAVGRIDADGSALVVADDEDSAPNQASVRLGGRIERALAQAGIEAAALQAVGCGRGPGTFTGTRVAVATAKGLAFGVGCPTIPVSTLAAVAATAGHEGLVLAILDARRDEVYGGRWRCEGLSTATPRVEPEGDERVGGLGELLEGAPSELRIAGTGVEPYRGVLEATGWDRAALALPGPSAAGLWAATVAAWRRDEALHPAGLDAVYLRASYAEMGINVPKRPFVKNPFV